MATVNGPKYAGPLVIDLSDVKNELVDLPPGARRGLRSEKTDIDKVIAELAQSMPTNGEKANISPVVYQRFVKDTADIVLLRKHKVELSKMLEVCDETLSKKLNNREDDISTMAKAAQDAARRGKDPGIAAPFEQTIQYNAQIADKAAQTRKKNAEAEAEQGAAGQSGGQAPPAQGGGQAPPA